MADYNTSKYLKTLARGHADFHVIIKPGPRGPSVEPVPFRRPAWTFQVNDLLVRRLAHYAR